MVNQSTGVEVAHRKPSYHTCKGLLFSDDGRAFLGLIVEPRHSTTYGRTIHTTDVFGVDGGFVVRCVQCCEDWR